MNIDLTRRKLLLAGVTGSALALCSLPARTMAQLTPTPAQSSGPFYPLQLPQDDDNDLVSFDGSNTPAKGEITHLTGQVVDVDGLPVANARVEIWQCDANGRYRHPWDENSAALDPNFQGHGSYQCSEDGRYRFRTIRPVAYPGRTPHIHFAISGPGFEPLVTQMYVSGEPLNDKDFILNNVHPELRQNVLVDLVKTQRPDEWSGHFRIVLAADGSLQKR
ncbi:MAG: protocatechuate 3,4-dioxygenase [Gammaproteobacteria bacterium]|nr:protocatechuate 3,4-dioxygenase [Gammaproteobacteria bacterium]